ncbi:MAG: acetyl-CoA C-acyltransferase [Promethearchaeota archaeon]|nr:MAG: acetyl-CoA C-acyltransferase [Candidatus Lokiarchaeota archaeon]
MDTKEVWLIDYARTAFSRSRPGTPERDVFGDQRADELMAQLLMKFFDDKLAAKGIKKEDIDEYTIGAAMGVGENWTYGGRLPLFMASFPVEVPGLFVDRQCGSAGSGLHVAAMEIMLGYSKCCLSSGFEHMTRVGMDLKSNPHIKPNLLMINKKDKWYRPEYDLLTTTNMLQTAQKLYEYLTPAYTKEDLDKFGVRSHNLTVENQEKGWFDGEIIPLEGHAEGNPDEKMMITKDMAARPSKLESVAGLRRLSKPFFLKKNWKGEDIGGRKGYIEREGGKDGVITAGNSSPLNAGATAAVLMEAEEAKKRGLEPMAIVRSIGWAGVDPTIMGWGPIPATEMALKHAGMTADQIDFWEINEAFCIVALGCMHYFNIPEKIVNIKGGSTAIGHPLGSTMVRLPGTLARILKDQKAKYGIANACCGGGQGVAVLLENPDV